MARVIIREDLLVGLMLNAVLLFSVDKALRAYPKIKSMCGLAPRAP